MAPEVIEDLSYTTTVDYFSLGLIVYEMALGKHPLHKYIHSYMETRKNGHTWYVTSDRIHFSRQLTGPRWRKESHPEHFHQNQFSTNRYILKQIWRNVWPVNTEAFR
ncbi:uncharacterized protein LOC143934010 [Lithobates pipiens]